MKHLQKTRTPKKKVILIANVEKEGNFYFCDDMVYRTEYMNPYGLRMSPSLCILVLLFGFFVMMAGRDGGGFFLFLNLIFAALCALSLWLSEKRKRELIIGAEKIVLRNMDEKTAYKIKWLAGVGEVGWYLGAARISASALGMATTMLLCAAFGIAGADYETVYPFAVVLFEVWLYLKLFMQERAQKECAHRLMEFFNEYKENKAQSENDYIVWEENSFEGL